MSKFGCKKFLVAVAALGLGIAGQAKAAYTTIGAPATGEKSQAQILSHALGGTFVADGLNLTNGTTTAVRVDDNFDKVFNGTLISAKTIGTFASYSQGLEVNGTQLFNVTGKGFNAVGSWTGSMKLSDSALVRDGKGYAMSSDNSANVDGLDHMVTYILHDDVTKLANGKKQETMTIVSFFEDKSKGQKSDFDFNDLAVESKIVCPVVPLPAAAWSGLATLAGGIAVQGARKARRLMA